MPNIRAIFTSQNATDMDYQQVLNEIYSEITPFIGKGKVADYIPALARVDANQFAMAVVTIDGKVFSVGDSATPFSIQSISKALTFTMAFAKHGDRVWERVGKEPSGNAFNSLVQLEYEQGIPRNPFINAGALVISDLILSLYDNPLESLRGFARELSANSTIDYNAEVALSEMEHGNRNAALAYFMRSFGNVTHNIDQVLNFYFHQCSLEMNAVDLARSFLFLANHGVIPNTGRRVLTQSQAKRTSALMLTTGLYNESGEFAFRVGIPAKSGVGGGIVGVIPQLLAVAAWSPALNKYGNSTAAFEALERFTTKTGVSVF